MLAPMDDDDDDEPAWKTWCRRLVLAAALAAARRAGSEAASWAMDKLRERLDPPKDEEGTDGERDRHLDA